MKIKSNSLHPLLQSLVFVSVWLLYQLYVSPYAFVTIDECSATPGADSSRAIIILPVYFLLFGGMIFYIFRNFKTLISKILTAICFVVIIPLLFAVIALFILDTGPAKKMAHHLNIWFDVYYSGCYGDIEVKDFPVVLITAIMLFFSLWTFIRFNKGKTGQ
ncbi:MULTISPECIES: hypothetical protein [Chitinophagaceae]